MDLESEEKVKHAKKVSVKAAAPDVASFEEKQVHHVQELLDKTATHMQQLEFDFQAVKADMADLKNSEQLRLQHATKKPAAVAATIPATKPVAAKSEVVPAKSSATTESNADADEAADFAAADGEDNASFIQFDDMNNGVEDDDSLVPLAPRAMRSNFIANGEGESSVTFGMTSDGTRRTYDLDSDGTPIVNPIVDTIMPPTAADSNEAKLSNSSVVPDTEKDVVCVCKRRRAPRGDDRVKCKKHFTPTPTPTPTPSPIKGIRQCVNGTWQGDADSDAGTNDVICIYWPAQMPLIVINPTPTPGPSGDNNNGGGDNGSGGSGEPEYPPECYDERNEFVADGVIEKRQYDVLLLQQGFETCGC